eukprot:TRINITY_DN8308_c0_g1_i3.p1 TRINITY_DN8308_c0_g1~~TRINITY_DN8308_c0_g1_i3.p1  ORF type:complete len:309 (-),score=53.87 TRINITY_DN8308_c0_g1_i3:114-1040(-)
MIKTKKIQGCTTSPDSKLLSPNSSTRMLEEQHFFNKILESKGSQGKVGGDVIRSLKNITDPKRPQEQTITKLKEKNHSLSNKIEELLSSIKVTLKHYDSNKKQKQSNDESLNSGSREESFRPRLTELSASTRNTTQRGNITRQDSTSLNALVSPCSRSGNRHNHSMGSGEFLLDSMIRNSSSEVWKKRANTESQPEILATKRTTPSELAKIIEKPEANYSSETVREKLLKLNTPEVISRNSLNPIKQDENHNSKVVTTPRNQMSTIVRRTKTILDTYKKKEISWFEEKHMLLQEIGRLRKRLEKYETD